MRNLFSKYFVITCPRERPMDEVFFTFLSNNKILLKSERNALCDPLVRHSAKSRERIFPNSYRFHQHTLFHTIIFPRKTKKLTRYTVPANRIIERKGGGGGGAIAARVNYFATRVNNTNFADTQS